MLNIKIVLLSVFVLFVGCSTPTIKKKNIDEIRKDVLTHKEEDLKLSKNKFINKYWNVRYFVDDFGKETNDGYVSVVRYIKGSFSNSATTDSKLLVDIISSEEEFGFKLFEYGRKSPVKGYLTQVVYTIKMRDDKGKDYLIYGDLWKESNRISVRSEYIDTIRNLLIEGRTLQVVLQGVTYGATYSFTIDGKHYGYHYRRLLEKRLK